MQGLNPRPGEGLRYYGRLLAIAVAMACAPVAVMAADGDAPSAEELPALTAMLPDLRRGGYVIYFRHAATDHASNDIDIDFERCETQRRLSELGRQQATAIGKAFALLAIPVGRVIASPFCRTRDTAQLAFGHYEVSADLHFAISVGADERERLAQALRQMLSTAPATGTNTVIVAHTANLKEAAGIWPKPEGVAYVFRPQPGGSFSLVARQVNPADWTAVAVEARQ